MRRVVAFLLGVLVLLAFPAGAERLEAVSGQLDLSNSGWTGLTPIVLRGEWLFYGHALLTPQDFDEGSTPQSGGVAVLPRRWNGDAATGGAMTGFDAATYRLFVDLPQEVVAPDRPALALDLGEIYTASRVFANGVEILVSGRPSLQSASDVPLARGAIATLPRAAHLEIILQVSNHFHFEGGPIGAITLGQETELRRDITADHAQKLLLTGVVAAMGVFFLALFLSERHERGYLYFALLSLLCVIRVPCASRVVYDLWPDAPHRLVAYLEYSSMYLLGPAYLLFLRWLFPAEMPRLAVRATALLCTGLAVLAAVLPPPFMSQTRDPFLVFIVVLELGAFLCVVQAVRHKRPGSTVIMLAFIAAAFCIFNDLALYLRWIRSVDLAQVGYVALALGHAWVLGRGVEAALVREGQLARDLSALNLSLEAQVAERTHHLQAEVERRAEAERTAAAASRAKSDFLATMSHEIRTPLNGMLGMATLLTDGPLEEDQRRRAEAIVSSGEALLSVINDVLDISKIEAQRMELDRHPFSVEAMVRSVVELMAPATAAKSIALALEVDPQVPAIAIGDAARLRQIVTNLVGNAVKFTEAGRIDVSVCAPRVSEAGFELYIEVKDTGIGIAPGMQPHVFEAFTQVDQSRTRRFGGTGLGLAICRRLVELMAGEIGFESRVGVGSRFWFRVPLGRGHGVQQPEILVPVSERESLCVLIAEDNQVNQLVVAGMLRYAGHQVDVVGDGAAAVDAALTRRYDLILMDLHMPEMDGLAATRAIRQSSDPTHASVPIIALTANALAEERARCLAAGMNDYLTKPVRREELLNRVGIIAAIGSDAPQAESLF